MNKKKKPFSNEPHLFMDQAEEAARAIVGEHPHFRVWRGEMLHKGSAIAVDTVLVGLSDDANTTEVPDYILLTAYLRRPSYSATIEAVETCERGISCTSLVPFGGGWVPLEEFKNFLIEMVYSMQ